MLYKGKTASFLLQVLIKISILLRSHNSTIFVLSISLTLDHIPHRLYQTWNCRGINIEAHVADDYEPSDQAPSMVIETLTQLLKLGSYINRQPKTSLKNTMESLHDKVPELLPPQGVLAESTDFEEVMINMCKNKH